MPRDEIAQIRVGRHRTGIIGLKHVLEEVSQEFADRSDDKITGELIRRLSKLNYMPKNSLKDYKPALLREYKKFVGQPYERSSLEGLEIKVLGSGCPCCDGVEQDLMSVITEMDLVAEIEHVTDATEIGNYGVTGTPALIINGKVKCVGKIPTKEDVKKWLME